MRKTLINFVKSSSTTISALNTGNDIDGGNDGERTAEFYQNLVMATSKCSEKSDQKVAVLNRKSRKINSESSNVPHNNHRKFDANEFFKCVEADNIEGIDQCLASGLDVDTQDMYGWTALMVAVCQHRMNAAKHLLQQGASLSRANRKGETALDIAAQRNFTEFVTIIANIQSAEPTSSLPNSSLTSHLSDVPGFCEDCKQQTTEMRRHCSSVPHLLKKPIDPPKIASFALSNKNRGYQLMLRQGWTGNSGLGADESGRLYPIKTTIKNDRLGVGLHNKGFATSARTIKFSTLAEIRNKHKRDKLLEKRIRSDFNTD